MGLTYPGSDGAIVSNDTPPGTKPLQRPVPIIKADRLEYLLWDVADIPEQEQYLQDFGMLTVQTDDASLYMRGHGCAHYLYAGR
jgi:hypothetical protein